jgi:DNA-binding CsgD family transcriptional regulator
MIPIEFYIDPRGEELIISQGNCHSNFCEEHIDLIKHLTEGIESRYPECNNRLTELYNSRSNFQYLKAKRFAKCNFGFADEIPDIDADGSWNLEKVKCPLRGGFCNDEGIICMPRFNSGLTRRENEVIQLINRPVKEIANTLFISVSTCENHIANIKRKLQLGTNTDLTHYAMQHNILK